jgi:hypothetical protein
MFFCYLVTQKPQETFWSHFIPEVLASVKYTISNIVKNSTKKKKKMALHVKWWTWICNQKDYLQNNLSSNLKIIILWLKSSFKKCLIEFTGLCAASPCCTYICFTPISFKTSWQFTPLLNLCSLIFGLTPFAWVHTRTPPRK